MPEITYGRWNPSEIRDRIMDNTWTGVESVSGMEKIVPSSIDFSGESASLNISTGAINFVNISFIRINGVFSSTYALYKMITDISSNVFDGTTLRIRVSTGAGGDHAGSNYSFTYNYIYGSSLAASGSNNQTSWMYGNIFQQSFPDEGIFYRNPASASYISFFKKGLFDDNTRDDFTYAIYDVYANSYTAANYTSLYIFPANNLEFITGTINLFGYK